MDEMLISLLAFATVISLGGTLVLLLWNRRRRLRKRLEGESPGQAPGARTDSQVGLGTGALTNIGRTLMGKKGASTSLKEQLARAGLFGDSAPSVYMGTKFLLLILGLGVVGGLLMMTEIRLIQKSLLTVVAAGVLFLIPNLVVSARRKRRTREVRQNLPDAVDLMEVCVSSGMGMETAWNVVSDEMRRVSSILADEMALTNFEIHLGARRVEAMRNLATRTGVSEIASMVAVLAQSERFGTSIADALQAFGQAMRENRSMQAQEAAERMAVKLLLPLCGFIFPAVLIVLVGPAGVVLSKIMATN